MTLPDLLQWVSANRKTGVLELERDKIFRRVQTKEGHIVACASSDPQSRLGQLLYSTGKITKDNLRVALARQEATGQYVGHILQEMGVLTESEISSQISASAEETIYSLFDWEDAFFRFEVGATLPPPLMQADISVDEILLNGVQRLDELAMIRKAFDSSGIVLERTDLPAPRQVDTSGLARRIIGSIDGERTLAEIVLHTHASEFMVLKFLYHLQRKKIVAIRETRAIEGSVLTILDREQRRDESSRTATHDPDADEGGGGGGGGGGGVMARGEYDAALEVLNACQREHPEDGSLRTVITRVESAYVERAKRHDLAPNKIPVLTCPESELRESNLPPDCLFLLSLIDGRSDICSILWLAPLKEVEVLRALVRLQEQGHLELKSPAPREQPASA
jgi:hypothetical protein